jgi:hypothetical protein
MSAVELRDEPEIPRKCCRGNHRSDERLHGDAYETRRRDWRFRQQYRDGYAVVRRESRLTGNRARRRLQRDAASDCGERRLAHMQNGGQRPDVRHLTRARWLIPAIARVLGRR